MYHALPSLALPILPMIVERFPAFQNAEKVSKMHAE
jgi:hypothetical protein